MKLKTSLIGFMAVMLLSAPAWGATKYAEAVIEKGKMTVLSKGQRAVYTSKDQNVVINHSDIIRLGSSSKVVLRTVEKATLTLGSNAVLHVEPWQRKEKKGAMRMLFGRFRAVVTGLSGGERFNVRTATATIGVKGTELVGLTNTKDQTVMWVESSKKRNPVDLTGLLGDDKEVPVGFVSAVYGVGEANRPVRVTGALREELQNLDSPAPNSPAASTLPPAVAGAGLKAEGGEGDADAGDDEGGAATTATEFGQDQADAAQQQASDAATENFSTKLKVEFQ